VILKRYVLTNPICWFYLLMRYNPSPRMIEFEQEVHAALAHSRVEL
jgi:hypothetical protein